ncbi:hypothetical protein IIY24_02275 [Candidatus Saccharibacteria bacterium]|nr:hypothetical protein [Candidatus Saccharibacteria bacterium]
MKLKPFKTIILVIASLVGFSAFSLSPAFATNPCDGNLPETVREANGCEGSEDKLPGIVINIINAIITVLGIVAVIFIIIGGVQYMTSTGDAPKIKKARDTILYAVIGLAVCVLAFAIVNFVIKDILFSS